MTAFINVSIGAGLRARALAWRRFGFAVVAAIAVRGLMLRFRNARYVILENVTIVGGTRHGVLVETSEDVRILNCDISG